jgi:hypothetical protein
MPTADIDRPEIDPRWGTVSPLHDPHTLAFFQARPTDVIITTAPKAGTTWMQQILHQMRTGGDTSFKTIFEVVPWIEWPIPSRTWRQALALFESLPNPRVFKTHCTYAQTPGVGTAKIILTVRDPRECCVSFFHHVNGFKKELCPTCRTWPSPTCSGRRSLPARRRLDPEREGLVGAPERSRHPDAALLRPRRGSRRERGSHRGLPRLGAHAGARARVLEHSSIEWMRKHSDRFTRQLGTDEVAFKPDTFIRRGKVGVAHEDLTAGPGGADPRRRPRRARARLPGLPRPQSVSAHTWAICPGW